MKDDNANKEKVVDLTYVTELSRGKKEFIKEIITIFLSENPKEIKILEKAIAEDNYELIKSTAHKLKSTIHFIGLDKVIGHEVTEMEALASNGSKMEMIREYLIRVKSACEKAYTELNLIKHDL